MGTVFVIGGAGFVGRHLVRHLTSHGSRVFATCRPGCKPSGGAGVEWQECDLTSNEVCDRWPGRYDALVYLAQSSHWRDFPASAADIFYVNLAALHRAAEHARNADAKRFIHFSTGTVYSQTREPAREDEPIRPDASRSFYASTKLAAELLLQPYTQFFGVTQLRLFMPYGVGQNDRMLLPSIVAKVRDGVHVDLHGSDGLRCNPVAIADVVEAVRRCLDLTGSQTLNIAGPEVLSLRQVAESIGIVLGKPPRFQVRSETPPVIVGDTTRLREALGWRPETRLPDGVRAWLSGSGG
jgi:nucleoside-diphosphate-sugar epimerase